MQNLSVGLDPRVLAQVQIMRHVTCGVSDQLKILGVTDVEKFVRKDLDLPTRRQLPTKIRRLAKQAATLEEFVAAIDVTQQAYLMVNGPQGKVLIETADQHGKRWFDNKLQQALTRRV